MMLPYFWRLLFFCAATFFLVNAIAGLVLRFLHSGRDSSDAPDATARRRAISSDLAFSSRGSRHIRGSGFVHAELSFV